MSEIERLLSEILKVKEQELRQAQERQEMILTNHQLTLENYAKALHHIQQQIATLNSQQKESGLHLQRLSAIHANLKPLLMQLSGFLGIRARG
ncbi:MAG: hypothetical protein B193_1345 [Solidesulfovibrio magneticus str. Maddingley MBC34]|uniref:Uncharacterized protein n=1 Tax=Solidesulfovibrio magneticus str. Maddingley MBC34 TaxID=1206767 RepID=K6GSN5_9BACT|nr:MAG: hypothetical protein B193_1345 [Solidesulfovibrio magneticus str. Maddingley MBC34]